MLEPGNVDKNAISATNDNIWNPNRFDPVMQAIWQREGWGGWNLKELQ